MMVQKQATLEKKRSELIILATFYDVQKTGKPYKDFLYLETEMEKKT